jgi:DNA-directed RNA polymerase subunit RPC12/RpoP
MIKIELGKEQYAKMCTNILEIGKKRMKGGFLKNEEDFLIGAIACMYALGITPPVWIFNISGGQSILQEGKPVELKQEAWHLLRIEGDIEPYIAATRKTEDDLVICAKREKLANPDDGLYGIHIRSDSSIEVFSFASAVFENMAEFKCAKCGKIFIEEDIAGEIENDEALCEKCLKITIMEEG